MLTTLCLCDQTKMEGINWLAICELFINCKGYIFFEQNVLICCQYEAIELVHGLIKIEYFDKRLFLKCVNYLFINNKFRSLKSLLRNVKNDDMSNGNIDKDANFKKLLIKLNDNNEEAILDNLDFILDACCSNVYENSLKWLISKYNPKINDEVLLKIKNQKMTESLLNIIGINNIDKNILMQIICRAEYKISKRLVEVVFESGRLSLNDKYVMFKYCCEDSNLDLINLLENEYGLNLDYCELFYQMKELYDEIIKENDIDFFMDFCRLHPKKNHREKIISRAIDIRNNVFICDCVEYTGINYIDSSLGENNRVNYNLLNLIINEFKNKGYTGITKL